MISLCLVHRQNARHKPYGFDLMTEDEKVYYPLAADTQAEMDEWIAVLTRAIASEMEDADGEGEGERGRREGEGGREAWREKWKDEGMERGIEGGGIGGRNGRIEGERREAGGKIEDRKRMVHAFLTF